MGVSVIIPVYNEEQTIGQCLTQVASLEQRPYEVIVVDGGSTDNTLKIAAAYDCRVISCPSKGRAHQLDFASREAQGDILCYLHSDTIPNPRLVPIIESALHNKAVSLGAFRSIMKGRKVRHVISAHNYLKTYYAPFFFNPYKTLFKGLRLLFGDQVMFCRKQDYIISGGFDLNEEVMEEAAFCLRMNELGKVIQLNDKVYSSDRRVVKWGVFKAHFLYIAICTGWGWGISSKKLAKLYPDIR